MNTYLKCPVCGKGGIRAREDGTLGRHRTPYVCRESSFCDGDSITDPRKRVTVSFEANVPAEWTRTEVTRWARSLLTDSPLGDDATAVSVGVIL